MDKKELLKSLNLNLNDNISVEDLLKEMDNYICPLDRKNADLIEGRIRVSGYENTMLQILKDHDVYHCTDVKKSNSILNKKILEEFVWEVAKVNHIQGKKRATSTLIVEYILNKGLDFYENLKEGKLNLVEEMNSYVFERTNPKRNECSWCSKVCKLLHEFLFDDDKYFIYDSNILNRLNDYRMYYRLERTPKNSLDVLKSKNWYQNFWNSLNELKDVLKDDLKRREIDHIIWGFHKYKVDLIRV